MTQLFRRLNPANVVPILFAGVIVVSWCVHGMLFSAPSDADAVFFEILAVNMATRNEMSGALTAEVRDYFAGSPQSSAIFDGADSYFEREIRALGIDGRNAYRPPLFPFLLSLPHRIFGPSFLSAKVLNLFFVTTGIWFLILASMQVGGRSGGWIAGVLAFVDPFSFVFSSTALTEGLGFFGVSALTWLMLRGFLPETSPKSWGALLGVLTLVRPVFVFWAPFLLFRFRSSVRSIFSFALLFALVVGPWAVRNSLLLGKFAPLGSQGSVILGMVYGEKTLERGGNWTPEGHQAFLQRFADLPRENRELQLMQEGEKIFHEWVAEHPWQVPTLIVRRIVSFWWTDAMPYQHLLSLLAGVGLLLGWRFPWARMFALLLFAHTAAIALVGNAARSNGVLYGRYLYSVHPFLIVAAAYAIRSGVEKLFKRVRTPAREVDGADNR